MKQRPSFQFQNLTNETQAVIALSYKTGIPFNDLADLPSPIFAGYLHLLQEEVKQSNKK